MKYLITIPILVTSLSINAEVITDGTLGQNINLPGPDFQIEANLGSQVGDNLFHSFQDFNLNSSESATFSGPNSVQNILSRVTGGNPSNIDGLIRSTISNADMYFLNPYGIMFGPNAKLDVQGSFHASTADYLRLGENGRFDARYPSDSLLNVAPVEAFGFLTDSPSSINTNDSDLSLLANKTISLIGGDITLQGTNAFRDKKRNPVGDNLLVSESGRINLISINGKNEVKLTASGLNFSNDKHIGTINSENTVLNVTGDGGGDIFIRGGEIEFINTQLDSQTLGDHDGGIIDIQGKNLSLLQGSETFVTNTGKGDATKFNIQVNDKVEFSGMNHTKRASTIDARSRDKTAAGGDASKILIKARDIAFLNGAHIYSENYGGGNGSQITMQAKESLLFSDVDSSGWRIGGMTADGLGQVEGSGHSSDITLTAKNITFEKGAGIQSGTNGKSDLGNITIRASEKFVLQGEGPDGGGSVLHSRVMDQSSGAQGGELLVEAGDVIINNGGRFFASTDGIGRGGDITIRANGTITLLGTNSRGEDSRIVSNSRGGKRVPIVGDAGTITLEAENFVMKDGANISSSAIARKGRFAGKAGTINITVKDKAILSGFNSESGDIIDSGSGIYAISEGIGDNSSAAGTINFKAGSLTIEDGGVIATSTNNNAQGGDITLQIGNTLKIVGDTELTHQKQNTSGIYASSDSVDSQAGQGGNITLQATNLVLTNNGQIATSSAGGGTAGNIILDVTQLRLDNEAIITSDSSLPNSYQFNTIAERDNHILIFGDAVNVLDNGRGKVERYVNVGQNLFKTQSVYTVENLTELQELSKIYQLEYGNIVEVKDAGNGQPAQFYYAYNNSFFIEKWIRYDGQADIVLEHIDDLPENDRISPDEIPYANDIVIQVNDMGDGTTGKFMYSNIPLPTNGLIAIDAARIRHFTVADAVTLHQLLENTTIKEGDEANVGNERFIFADNRWVPLTGNMIQVTDVPSSETLVKPQVGNIAKVSDTDFIYTGQHWINLNSNQREVTNLSELQELTAETGDLVKVAGGTYQQANFFYADGQWLKQVKGGNAGTITITANDAIRLFNDSTITTEAASSGGGGVNIDSPGFILLQDSQITTSVLEGVGTGGDMNLNPKFIVLDNANIIARANEGHGGNININTNGIYRFPPESASSIDASSKLGVDGEVVVNSPDMNMEGFLVILSDETVEASSLMKKPCSMRGSSFTVQKIAGSPQTPYDYNPSTYLPETDKKVKTVSKNSGEKLAFSTCKK
ncbi:filamentous hemagglutinin N-terminal domain-containing protein [Candidatus Halobeggiatoa sp. HSG11]|nr:filamentous hemagglutinin N-terminal domain-containing protein [Candidatus Halobeggiatoa sp. HSG11]